MTQVMHDSAAVAHPTPRHNQASLFHAIERSRLARAGTRSSTPEITHQLTRLDHLQRFRIEQLIVSAVNPRRLDRHRAIEKNREARQRLSLKSPGQQIEE